MARPRTFNPENVLNVARELFWRQGYQNTSLDDITAATGLSKPSLYAAFGDKSALFGQVLDRYHELVLARSAKTLSEGADARTAVETWLTQWLPIFAGEREQRGCLSVNTLTDGAPHDSAVRDSVAGFNARLEALLIARIEADRARLGPDFDATAAARAIVALYIGLMAMAKRAPGPEPVKAVIAQAGKLLA